MEVTAAQGNEGASNKRHHSPDMLLSSSWCNLPAHGEHKKAISSVAFAPSRLTKTETALCASASADGLVKLWEVNEKVKEGSRRDIQPVQTYAGHARGINQVCWNNSAALLATASDDKTLRLWDASTAETLVEFKGHDNFVFCVDQHYSMLCSGSFDETVKLWDIRSGDCVSTLPAHSDPVTAVSFNRDGTTICSASHDGLIRIWDVATGECLKTIYAAKNPPVAHVVYSPNGKFVLANTLDSTIRLWPVNKVGSQQCSKTYRDTVSKPRFVNFKYSVQSCFLPDGNIVTGSETNEVIIFDLQKRSVVQTLKGHNDAVLAVAAHDRQSLIASGGMTSDRKVEFWSKSDFSDDAGERQEQKRMRTD